MNTKKPSLLNGLKDCLKYLQRKHSFKQQERKNAMLAANLPKFHLDGKWKSPDAEIISYKESATGNLELVWVESKNGKFRFSGNMQGLESKGTIEKWRDHFRGVSLILTNRDEGKYEIHGDGLVFLTNNLNTLTIKVQESAGNNHRSVSFRKIGAAN
jgi:hypothetical protein